MTRWQIGRGWPDDVIQAELAALAAQPVSYGEPLAAITDAPGWTVERFQALLGYEPSGPPLPDGLFVGARLGVAGYRFADPRITRGHFDPQAPLLGRDLLVEIRPLFVRLLAGLRIGDVLDTADATETRFGIRMDTLEGHVMHGSEWVQVAKDHRTGAVTFRIEVQWRMGRMPTWWMVPGFRLLGRQFQARWRRQAVRRLRRLGQMRQAPGGHRQAGACE